MEKGPPVEPPRLPHAPQVIITGPGGCTKAQRPTPHGLCPPGHLPDPRAPLPAPGQGELPWPFRLDPHSLLCS